MHRLLLCIPIVDEHRLAARAASSLYVLPTIPDHVASRQIQIVRACRSHKHSRTRLSARAEVTIIVVANAHFVNRQQLHEVLVDCVDQVTTYRSSRGHAKPAKSRPDYVTHLLTADSHLVWLALSLG